MVKRRIKDWFVKNLLQTLPVYGQSIKIKHTINHRGNQNTLNLSRKMQFYFSVTELKKLRNKHNFQKIVYSSIVGYSGIKQLQPVNSVTLNQDCKLNHTRKTPLLIISLEIVQTGIILLNAHPWVIYCICVKLHQYQFIC